MNLVKNNNDTSTSTQKEIGTGTDSAGNEEDETIEDLENTLRQLLDKASVAEEMLKETPEDEALLTAYSELGTLAIEVESALKAAIEKKKAKVTESASSIQTTEAAGGGALVQVKWGPNDVWHMGQVMVAATSNTLARVRLTELDGIVQVPATDIRPVPDADIARAKAVASSNRVLKPVLLDEKGEAVIPIGLMPKESDSLSEQQRKQKKVKKLRDRARRIQNEVARIGKRAEWQSFSQSSSRGSRRSIFSSSSAGGRLGVARKPDPRTNLHR